MKRKKLKGQEENFREIAAYDHKNHQRMNNPLAGISQDDNEQEKISKYAFDPDLDPELNWSGKEENSSLEVVTSSIHIHEAIKPSKILHAVQNLPKEEMQGSLFETPRNLILRRQAALEFYKHGIDWTNRLIAGDNLIVMNSLLQKEGMGGKVQMIYFDPPYGIKYGSNFQPFIGKRDVKDRDEDLSTEPETIKAFRDTWELGIHSYLTYLHSRLFLARELLSESGSIFVQISDENVHHVREICDEVFGAKNFVAQIAFRKKFMPLGSTFLEGCFDYLIFYAKNKSALKYHQLFKSKDVEGDNHWNMIELPNGKRRKLTNEEINDHRKIPTSAKIFTMLSLYPAGFNSNAVFGVDLNEKTIFPPTGKSWKTSETGMKNLVKAKRVIQYESGDTIRYINYFDDYPVSPIMNLWEDTAAPSDKMYVVQTATKVIQRCMLMTTDPDDLVLDITCGSGTTAYVAEQWGRRWITCDTSRIAIEIAKKRLMTAVFEYYKLTNAAQGISSGFIYKTVPHITLKSIANKEPPDEEILFDRPEVDKSKIRISGPFTVESLPAPVVKSPDDLDELAEDTGAKYDDWREELLATGIIGKNGTKIEFSRVFALEGTKYLQAEAETKSGKRAVICFGDETKIFDSRQVANALNETSMQFPRPKYLIFAAFQFDAEAMNLIDNVNFPLVTLLKVQMNADLMTEDLKKKRSSNQSFWLIGQPDVELIKDKASNKFKVVVNGFDYYDTNTGKVISGGKKNIAMWMLDTDYDGMCIEPSQVFFPLDDGWEKLTKTLRAEINQDLIRAYKSNESLWFELDEDKKIAVKIIDNRGIESMKVLTAGDF